MSRIGIRPIQIPEGVTVEITPSKVTAICGAKKMEMPVHSGIKVAEENGSISVSRTDESKETRSLHGLTARLIKNLVNGVKEDFVNNLTFKGTGYRVAVEGNEVALNMGYSHEIRLTIPEGVAVTVKKNVIAVTGADKQVIGQFAALIRGVRGPEVYKGKGIKYEDEIIRRKAGKKAAA